MNEGRLYYFIGASGVGKDSLLRYARARLDDSAAVVFAHRYITRPADDGNENHVALTETEFDLRKRCGAFAMDWASHGYRYGIGTEIHYWLATGLSVVVNASRGYLADALRDYPHMNIIWVTASSEIVAGRLARRQRESAMEIEQRLNRNPAPAIPVRPRGLVVHLNNDGPIEIAGDALVAILREQAAQTRVATNAASAGRRS